MRTSRTRSSLAGVPCAAHGTVADAPPRELPKTAPLVGGRLAGEAAATCYHYLDFAVSHGRTRRSYILRYRLVFSRGRWVWRYAGAVGLRAPLLSVRRYRGSLPG